MVAAILAGLAAIPRSSEAANCTLHWTGQGGNTNWATPGNWDRGRIPIPADVVCIAAGFTVVHSAGTDSIATLQADGQLTISGGELDLTSTTDVSTATNLTLSGGTLGGTARIDLSGANNVWSGGAMADAGTTNVPIGATLHQKTNNGTLADGRVLLVGGTLTLESDTTVVSAGAAPQITNIGLIQRNTSSGSATINAPVDNDGTVEATTGVLNLAGGTGTGTSSGEYGAAAAGGEINLNTGTHTLAGAELLGHVNLTGATVTVPAGALVVASDTNTMSGGTLNGAGAFNIPNGSTFVWSGGTMDGGVTNIASGALLRQLTNNVTLANGRQLNNAGTFRLEGNTTVIAAGATPQITNTGLIQRNTTTAAATINAPVDNDGTVHADTGTLNLAGGTGTGTSSGDYGAAAAGGEINLNTGTHQLGDGVGLLGHVNLTGATVTIPNAATVAASGTNTMTGGTLGGVGTFNIAGTGTLVWTGGTMTGGATNVTSLATLRQLTNNVTLANGRQLNNAGTFRLEGNTTVIAAGATPQITNTGLIQRNTSSSQATISAPVDNDGTVHADTGTLNLAGGTGTGSSSGDYGAPSAGGEINLNTGTDQLGDGVQLLGHVNLTGATVTVPGGATVTASGANTMAGGSIGGAGSFDIPNGASFTWSAGTMDGGGALPGGATNVQAGGTLRQTTNNVTLANRRQLNVAGTLTLESSTTLISAGSAPQITNTGLIQRTAAAGTQTAINPPVDNQGVIDVRRGTLTVPSLTEDAAGTMRVLVTSATDFGRFALSGTPALTGTLDVETAAAHQLAVGNQLPIITYSGHTGSFTGVTGLNSGNVAYSLAYGSTAVTLTVTAASDTTPPPAPTITEEPATTTTSADAMFAFQSSEPGVTFSCQLDGAAFEPCTSPKGYSGLAAGAHTFNLRATDAAGNFTTTSRTWDIEAGQPQTIEDLPPPVIGQKANVEPVKGTVLIAVPAGGARAASAHSSQKGLKFVPLEEARQVPVGSFLDTRRGTVRLQSATGASSKVYDGDFAAGLFQVLQSRKKKEKGLTDLVLKGGSFSSCTASRRGKGATAAKLSKRTIRSLRGNAKGRFRTRGRHSAATVRGTKWIVADRCDGTLTKVQRGVVEVRDFRRKKTVIVRAGKSYLARAS
jgi:hypothetical protein